MPAPRWSARLELQGSNFKDKYAIAYLSLTLVSLFGVLWALIVRRARYDDGVKRRAFRNLTFAMVLYLLYFFLQMIDILIHERQLVVKGGYYFVSVFWDALWQFADFLIIIIACQITYFQFATWGANVFFHATWCFICMLSLTALAAVGLYRWALSTAYIILWLNGASYSQISVYLDTVDSLWVAYQILYMVLSFFLFSLTLYHVARRTRFRERFNVVEARTLALAIFLLIRSIFRAFYVIKYIYVAADRPIYLSTEERAVYGISTIIILLLMNHLAKSDPVTVVKVDILRSGRRAARTELRRRRIDASKGGPALPTPPQLLREIDSKPLLFLSDEAQSSMSLLSDFEVQDTLSHHIADIMRLRDKI